MSKCPSKFCGFENPEQTNFCVKCGLDLSLGEEEIINRDKFYECCRETFDKNYPEMKFSRKSVDYLIERFGATLCFLFADACAKERIEKMETLPKKGLYKIFFERLRELNKSKDGIIEFSSIFKNIFSPFAITKDEMMEIILIFRDFELLEVVAGKGVRVK